MRKQNSDTSLKRKKTNTSLPETNIALENRPLEKEIPIGNPPFLGATLVLGRVKGTPKCVGATSAAFSPVRNTSKTHPRFSKGSHASSTEPMQNPPGGQRSTQKTPPAPEFPPCFEPEFVKGGQMSGGKEVATHNVPRYPRSRNCTFFGENLRITIKTVQKKCFCCSRIHFLESFFAVKPTMKAHPKCWQLAEIQWFLRLATTGTSSRLRSCLWFALCWWHLCWWTDACIQ